MIALSPSYFRPEDMAPRDSLFLISVLLAKARKFYFIDLQEFGNKRDSVYCHTWVTAAQVWKELLQTGNLKTQCLVTSSHNKLANIALNLLFI